MRAGPKSLDEAVARTLEAMRAGVEVIYQGALRTGLLRATRTFSGAFHVPPPSATTATRWWT